MKKMYYLMVAMLLMFACSPQPEPEPQETPNTEDENQTPAFLDPTVQSTMQLFVGPMEITADTTITIAEAKQDMLTGYMQMEVGGRVSGVNAFRVDIHRADKNYSDELCAGIQCVAGDGEIDQTIDYLLPEDQTDAQWYAHFKPTTKGEYTIRYTFRNYNKTIALTVVYNYQGL